MKRAMAIHEARWPPAISAGIWIAFPAIVTALRTTSWLVAVTLVLCGSAGTFFLWRAIRPRWVLLVDGGVLRHRNLCTGLVAEFDLSSIVEVYVARRCAWGSGGEGGLGWENTLVVTSNGEQVELPLPFLCCSPQMLEQMLRESVLQRQERKN